MYVKWAEALMLLIFSIITDSKDHIIKNSVVFPFMLAGLVLNVSHSGLEGLADSAGGILFPFVILYALFSLNMLGAGDIKLLCALGSIFGAIPILRISLYTFFSGALIAIVFMAARKNFCERIGFFCSYIKTCFLTLRLQPYNDYPLIKSGAFFNFSYAVAGGMILYFIVEYIK